MFNEVDQNLADAAYPSFDDDAATLQQITLNDIPAQHPVQCFAAMHAELCKGILLPHEEDMFRHADAKSIFAWSKHIEPIEIEGMVDFKVLRQGDKLAEREKRSYRDQWMSDTLDPEFVDARYREIIAASILRKPMFSKGATPSRERSFINLLRGVFPVFAENQARLRLFEVAAEPYVAL
ncbi:MAG: hypothetical protein MRY63_01440 [Neomegalonema sp.]|nr:hypothetical protein [Neomegalonema sp.]